MHSDEGVGEEDLWIRGYAMGHIHPQQQQQFTVCYPDIFCYGVCEILSVGH